MIPLHAFVRRDMRTGQLIIGDNWRWCRNCGIRKGNPWPEQAWAVERRRNVLKRMRLKAEPPRKGGRREESGWGDNSIGEA